MAAEMNSDPPLKNSTELEEDEAFHNAADSFSTDDDNLAPPEQNPIADPSLDLDETEGNFHEVENRSPDEDLKTQIEEAPATVVVEKPSIGRIDGKMKQVSDDSGNTVKNKVKRSSRRSSSNGKKGGAGIIASGHREEWDNDNGGRRRVYTREEMVGMRFFGVVQQKRLWRDIYNGLGSAAVEYASLVDQAIPKNPKQIPRIIHNNAPSLAVLGGAIVAGSGATSPYNVMVQPYYPTMMKTCYSPEWAPYLNYGF